MPEARFRKLPRRPFLYVLTDPGRSGESHSELVKVLARVGVPVVQVREKEAGDRSLLSELRTSVSAAGPGCLLLVNDRVDLALASGADGVHLGQSDLPVACAREILGPDYLIGVSTHDLEEGLRAADTSADYLAVGPIFPTTVKPGRRPIGLEAISRLRDRTSKVIVAIGGIGIGRVRETFESGADGVAVLGAVMKPAQVAERACDMLRAVAVEGRD